METQHGFIIYPFFLFFRWSVWHALADVEHLPGVRKKPSLFTAGADRVQKQSSLCYRPQAFGSQICMPRQESWDISHISYASGGNFQGHFSITHYSLTLYLHTLDSSLYNHPARTVGPYPSWPCGAEESPKCAPTTRRPVAANARWSVRDGEPAQESRRRANDCGGLWYSLGCEPGFCATG